MNTAEITEVLQEVKNNWRSFNWDEGNESSWTRVLGGFTKAEAMKAIDAYGRGESSRFIPSAYDLEKLIAGGIKNSLVPNRFNSSNTAIKKSIENEYLSGMVILWTNHPQGVSYSLIPRSQAEEEFFRKDLSMFGKFWEAYTI